MADNKSILFSLTLEGSDKVRTEIEQLEKELQDLTEQQKKLNETKKKGQKLNGGQIKAQAKLRRELKRVRGEQSQLIRTYNAQTQSVKKLDNSYNGLVAQNKKLSASARALAEPLGKDKKKFDELTRAMKRNTDQLKKMDGKMGRSFRNVGNYGSAISGLASSFGIMGGVAGLAMAIKGAVGWLSDFEKGFANVLTLLSGEDVKKFSEILKEGSIRLIKDYGVGIEDVNKALFDTISAGVPAGNAIAFLEEATKLSVGGVTDLTTATDGLTSIMNAYGLANSEVEQVSSALFTAQKFGKTTVAELSAEVGKVAPIAKVAGVSYQELLSTFAELTKVGINTTESATAIKSAITAVLKPSEKAKEQFDALGISYGATSVRSEGLMTILRQISEAGEENADVVAQLVPNVRALTGVSALGADALDDYDKILKAVNEDYGENSSLAQAVATQQDTLSFQASKLAGTFKSLVLGGGGEFSDFLKTIVKFMTDLLENIKPVSEAYMQQWEALGMIFKPLKELIYELFPALNTEGGMAKNIMESLGLALKLFLVPITILSKSLGLVIKAITKLIKFFKEVAEQNDKMKEGFDQASISLKGLQRVFLEIIFLVNHLPEALDALVQAFKTAFNSIGDMASKTLGGMGKAFEGIFTLDWDKMNKGLDDMKKAFKDFGTTVAKSYSTSFSAQIAKDMENSLVTPINDLSEDIVQKGGKSGGNRLKTPDTANKDELKEIAKLEKEKQKLFEQSYKVQQDAIKRHVQKKIEIERAKFLTAYQNGEMTYKDYQKKLQEIQLYSLGLQLSNLDDYNKSKTGVEKKIADIKFKQSKDQIDIDLKQQQEYDNAVIEQKKMLNDAIQQMAIETMNSIFAREQENLQKSTQRDIDALQRKLDDGIISQENFEAQKLQLEKEAFKKKKKLDTIQAIINGAVAITKTIAQLGAVGTITPAGVALLALMGVMTATQVAMIQSQEFARGGLVQGKSHKQGGEKFAVGGKVVELEGGEAVINKRSTQMFKSELSAMNKAGGGISFAEGGLTQSNNLRALTDMGAGTASYKTNFKKLSEAVLLVNSRIDNIKVTNVVVDTTEQQTSVANIEADASF